MNEPDSNKSSTWEQQWLTDKMANNPLWFEFGSYHIAQLQLGQRLNLWLYEPAGIKVLSVWRVSDISLSPIAGLSVTLSSPGQSDFIINSTPKALEVDSRTLFLWVPSSVTLKFRPAEPEKGGNSVHTLSVFVKFKFLANPVKGLKKMQALYLHTDRDLENISHE